MRVARERCLRLPAVLYAGCWLASSFLLNVYWQLFFAALRRNARQRPKYFLLQTLSGGDNNSVTSSAPNITSGNFFFCSRAAISRAQRLATSITALDFGSQRLETCCLRRLLFYAATTVLCGDFYSL